MGRTERVVNLRDDRWYPALEMTQHVCCVCALTHDVKWRIRDGQIEYNWRTNRAATRRHYRRMNKRTIRARSESTGGGR